MKNVFLGTQNVSSGSVRNFISVGVEVKFYTDQEDPEIGYVVSIASEIDRSRRYVLRSEDDQIHTVERAEIASIRSQASGEWVMVN